VAPASASKIEQALPIPLPAPVTNAVFPARENISEIIGLLDILMIRPCFDSVVFNVSGTGPASNCINNTYAIGKAHGRIMDLMCKQ
jgi:hypothetical protein